MIGLTVRPTGDAPSEPPNYIGNQCAGPAGADDRLAAANALIGSNNEHVSYQESP